MTKSELLAIMCCGLATMSIDSIGVYSTFGINTLHLLAALVMSSPAALAVAKLLYPETEQSQAVDAEHLKLPKRYVSSTPEVFCCHDLPHNLPVSRPTCDTVMTKVSIKVYMPDCKIVKFF